MTLKSFSNLNDSVQTFLVKSILYMAQKQIFKILIPFISELCIQYSLG